jgi:transcription initiation factor TFIIE subunit alpha
VEEVRRWYAVSDKLNDLLSFIEMYCGGVCREVLNMLMKTSKEFLDEEIASELGVNVNEVRRALYDLQTLGIVSYRRERDEKDGKFIYYWYANIEHLNQLLLQRKKLVLKKLEERLKLEEENSFYRCPNDGMRLTFDEALENDFRCPKCNSLLEFYDNSWVKEKLKILISSLREEVVNEEKAITS